MFTQAAVLLAAACVAGLVTLFFFPAPQEAQAPISVSTEQAMTLWREKSALFVDARSAEAYARGHIAGAVRYEPGDTSGLPSEILLVVYCDDALCSLSREAAQALQTQGFTLVAVYEEGLGGWMLGDGPVEDGL